MDPFKALPSDVFNNILQYLSFNDIKEASVVSKNWYDIIGKSSECMRNVTLYFTDFHINYIQEKRDCLLKSNRLYHNLFIFFYKEDVHSKIPKIVRVSRSIICKFSSTLTYLYSTIDIQRISNLPKLKELHLKCFYENNKTWPLYYGGLTGSITLEKLEIFCYDMNKQAVKVLKCNLKKTKNLKSLCVNDSSIFDNWNTQDYKFELKEFIWRGQWNPDNDCLLRFIGAFKSTLELIEYKSDANYEDVVFFLSNLPKLKTLIIHFYDDFGNQCDSYPVNNTIKTLAIGMLDSFGDEAMSNLLLALPNLEVLKVKNLNDPIFQFARTSKFLKTVEYKWASTCAFRFKEEFPNINLIHNEKIWY